MVGCGGERGGSKLYIWVNSLWMCEYGGGFKVEGGWIGI